MTGKAACVVSTNTVSPSNGMEIGEKFHRSAALPQAERQRGQEHGGKARDKEKTLKLPPRKTCVVW